MALKTSAQETINALNAIFEYHKKERICVLGTTCCGKTTLLRQMKHCVDLDDELWPQLSKEEAVIYLDISDALLEKHCKSRDVDFADSKNVKEAVEEDWNHHREKGGKIFYYLMVTE